MSDQLVIKRGATLNHGQRISSGYSASFPVSGLMAVPIPTKCNRCSKMSVSWATGVVVVELAAEGVYVWCKGVL